jgi:competence CoiA-like predicted nuclease
MQIALKKDGTRISADKYSLESPVFCPVCGQKLIFKAGKVVRPYFSHTIDEKCLDNWHHEDMCEWHIAWQNEFPEKYREVVLKENDIVHRADVALGDVVVEFQHSPISL